MCNKRRVTFAAFADRYVSNMHSRGRVTTRKTEETKCHAQDRQSVVCIICASEAEPHANHKQSGTEVSTGGLTWAFRCAAEGQSIQ